MQKTLEKHPIYPPLGEKVDPGVRKGRSARNGDLDRSRLMADLGSLGFCLAGGVTGVIGRPFLQPDGPAPSEFRAWIRHGAEGTRGSVVIRDGALM